MGEEGEERGIDSVSQGDRSLGSPYNGCLPPHAKTTEHVGAAPIQSIHHCSFLSITICLILSVPTAPTFNTFSSNQ